MTLEENKEVVRKYVDEFLVNRDFSRFDRYVAPGFHIHRSAVPEEIRGSEGLSRQMDMFYHAFPNLDVQIKDMVAEGDKVVVRFEAPGTHQNEFAGIPPTGRDVVWKGLVMYRFTDDGRIAEAWGYWDDYGLLEQLR